MTPDELERLRGLSLEGAPEDVASGFTALLEYVAELEASRGDARWAARALYRVVGILVEYPGYVRAVIGTVPHWLRDPSATDYEEPPQGYDERRWAEGYREGRG